ncbi:MAG: SH3 domain-containing protein [Chryseobacterium sp.]|nr:SH3 domain-containing protein [Chryseobacterium sp.]
MRNILLLVSGIVLMTLSLFSFSKSENNGHNGRCTGSAYCTACSNCSRCGHCGAGGTCGVCSNKGQRNISITDYSAEKPNTSKSYKASRKSGFQKTPNTFIDHSDITILTISERSTNIFEKPSFQSKVVENISKNEKLIQISKLDNWYKIKVKSSGKIGFIYYKDVKS